ncbi:MAG: tol-pal system YbgF family protein, partial [Bradymonadaceae bacterium]
MTAICALVALAAPPRPASAQSSTGAPSSSDSASGNTDDEGLVSDDTSDEQCPKNLPPEEASDAKQLTLLGVSCFKVEQFAQAYTYYHRAYQIEQSDALRAAMGRSLHELGVYELAKFYYEDFLEGQSSDSGSVQKIRNRLGQLNDDIDGKGVRTKLQSLPPNATVHLQISNGD